jgi:hypothetical protein
MDGIFSHLNSNGHPAGTSSILFSDISSSDNLLVGCPFDSVWVESLLRAPPTHFLTLTLPRRWSTDIIKRDSTVHFAIKATNRRLPRAHGVGFVGFWEIGGEAGLQHIHGLVASTPSALKVMSAVWIDCLHRFNPSTMTGARLKSLFWKGDLQSAQDAFNYSAKQGSPPTFIQAPGRKT